MMIVSLILFGLFVFARGREVEDNTYHLRIVNGEDVKLGDIPYQVSLRSKKSEHFCGGTILNEYWVVTAAHCVINATVSDFDILAGTVDLLDIYSLHQCNQIIVHEGYTPTKSHVNDIALVQVATPFKFSNRIQAVKLPSAYSIPEIYTPAVVSGWGGKVNQWSPTPDILQKATIFIADPWQCKAIMQNIKIKLYRTQLCAYDPSIRRGQCTGDSGGPLTIDGKLEGIVSWSIKDPNCGSNKYPGIYTRVSAYVMWINQHIP